MANGHVEHLGQGLGEVGLAAAGRADEQDVGLGDLDVVGVALVGTLAGLDALVVVIDGNSQRLLGRLLAHDVGLQEVEDLARLGQLIEAEVAGLGQLLLDDLIAQVDALVADVDHRPGDQLLDLLLGLAAEGTLQQIAAFARTCHVPVLPSPLSESESADEIARGGETVRGGDATCRDAPSRPLNRTCRANGARSADSRIVMCGAPWPNPACLARGATRQLAGLGSLSG
jgi:hypothetical protein